jgi:hypothetical protein
MICGDCGFDRSNDDYLNNQKFCYHCEYQKKIEKKVEKRKPKPIYCRICNSEVVQKENLKKRQRSVFCCAECAEEGHRLLCRNHWTRRIRSYGVF